nr:15486_t:CDS:2 [Entrophospora candida]
MEPKLNITLHCSITGFDCYRLQNKNQRITVAKLTLPDISDNDSKSVNVTSETHPCGLMNNDQDAISSDTSIDDSSISSDAFDSNKSIDSHHAFNDISNITLLFKRSNNYNENEGHKFKFIKFAELAALKWQHSSVRSGSIIGPAESLDIP